LSLAPHADLVSLTDYMHAHPASPHAGVGANALAPGLAKAPGPDECFTEVDGRDYVGRRNVTRSGLKCRPWAVEYAHRDQLQGWPPPENLCRRVVAEAGCAACFPDCATTVACRRNRLECCDIGEPQPSCAPSHAAARRSPPPPPPSSDLSPSLRILMRTAPDLVKHSDGTHVGSATLLYRPGHAVPSVISSPPPPPPPPPPPSAPPPDSAECFTLHDASDYRGVQNISVNGYACQRWTSQLPNAHPYHPGSPSWDEAGLGSHNYCRRPGGFACAWCFVDKAHPPPFAEKERRRLVLLHDKPSSRHSRHDADGTEVEADGSAADEPPEETVEPEYEPPGLPSSSGHPRQAKPAWDCCDVMSHMREKCASGAPAADPVTAFLGLADHRAAPSLSGSDPARASPPPRSALGLAAMILAVSAALGASAGVLLLRARRRQSAWRLSASSADGYAIALASSASPML